MLGNWLIVEWTIFCIRIRSIGDLVIQLSHSWINLMKIRQYVSQTDGQTDRCMELWRLPRIVCMCSEAVAFCYMHIKFWCSQFSFNRVLFFSLFSYYFNHCNYFACVSGGEVLWWARLCVCLSVCPRGYLSNHTCDLYQIFVHIAYGRGSVLLRRGD